MKDPKAIEEAINEAHRRACLKGDKAYPDPVTGFDIFTRQYLLDRGFCCQQGCRHCPYEALNINPQTLNTREES